MDLAVVERASRSECSAILAAVAARILELDTTADQVVDDRTLDVREAAAMLGMTPANLYKAAQTTHRELRVDNGTRSIKFSAAKIAVYLRRGVRRDAGSTSPKRLHAVREIPRDQK